VPRYMASVGTCPVSSSSSSSSSSNNNNNNTMKPLETLGKVGVSVAPAQTVYPPEHIHIQVGFHPPAT
jgi:hypothetical protein